MKLIKKQFLSSGLKESGNQNKSKSEEKNTFPGYPASPQGDDIYNKDKEERDIDPEQPTENKETNEYYKNNPNTDLSGDDLDVPGSELDDEQEYIGSEDEENNYYSLEDDDQDDQEEEEEEQ